jgi:hypothetical protein
MLRLSSDSDETGIDFERNAEKKVRDCELRCIVLLLREAKFRLAGCCLVLLLGIQKYLFNFLS